MQALLIFALALLPVAILLFHIYKSDPIPEPPRQLFKAFLYGMAIVIPVSIIEAPISMAIAAVFPSNTLAYAGLNAFLTAAIPEEGMKLLALWLLVRKNPYFDEHIDGIVYAVFVSLGFAAIENVGYLFGNITEWQQVGIIRALLAVPGHYCFGVLMGFFFALYYFVNRSRRNKFLILGAPVLTHGIYDTFCFLADINEVMGTIGLVAVVAFSIWLHKFCRKRIATHTYRDNRIFGQMS